MTSSRVQKIASCGHCAQDFHYYLIHNGFNDSCYLYCDSCGKTAIFNLWNKNLPKGLQRNEVSQGKAPSALEPFVPECACSGNFRVSAAPRCPHCKTVLSAEGMTEDIEAKAAGRKKGWRWGGTWSGMYCIVIDDQLVEDNLRTSTSNLPCQF